MANWRESFGGAAGGAASGAAIGSVVPGIGTAIGAIGGGLLGAIPGLFDNSGDDYDKMLQLYQDTLSGYKGPESQPGYQDQMAGLGQMAQGGLNAGDRSALLDSYWNAANMAQGREGAIEQNARASGGGYANSGQMATLAAQAGQAGANRLQQAGTGAAGIAANRALQAKTAYLQQLTNNANSMNNYRLHAAGMLGGGYEQKAGYEGANAQAAQDSISGGLDSAGRLLATRPAAARMPALATGAAGNVGGDNYAAAMPGATPRGASPYATAGDFSSGYPDNRRPQAGGPRSIYSGGTDYFGA